MAKFDPFLSLDCVRVEGVGGGIQGKEGIKFCHLATLFLSPRSSRPPKVFPKGKGRGKEKETYLDGGKGNGEREGGREGGG